MIVQTQLEPGQVCGLRLVSGDEIIGKFIAKERTEYKLEAIHQVIVGEEGVTLIRWPLTSLEKAQLGIPIAHVLTVFEVLEDYSKSYEDAMYNETEELILPASETIN